MSVYTKLLNVQSELKAPKSQYNSFGKYKYRSCEDILEALKPILNKNKATVIISDDILFVEGRHYIKATVKFIDTENGETVENSALAREDEIKKGMDSSQITGSVSSYARKYALNGMFAIDDTKDSDSTNTHGVEPDKPKSNGKLSAKQVGRLLAIGLKVGIKEPEIKKVIKSEFGKDKIEDLSIEDYNSVCSRLEAKAK
ncbi:MAG: ERF family protein [Clostridium sp.]|nr:ERF family protein [Clostridium sp.]